ncbi:hypothetical protein EfmAA290_05530 [Enterococcus faecium]|nr:hypothetical protein EfmAA290_05530 [Enterococcus faecium]
MASLPTYVGEGFSNGRLPMIESLRVPTNADKKIYGHVVVPEGVEAKPREPL